MLTTSVVVTPFSIGWESFLRTPAREAARRGIFFAGGAIAESGCRVVWAISNGWEYPSSSVFRLAEERSANRLRGKLQFYGK